MQYGAVLFIRNVNTYQTYLCFLERVAHAVRSQICSTIAIDEMYVMGISQRLKYWSKSA